MFTPKVPMANCQASDQRLLDVAMTTIADTLYSIR